MSNIICISNLEVMVVRGHGKKKTSWIYIWKYHENPEKKKRFCLKWMDGNGDFLIISHVKWEVKVGGQHIFQMHEEIQFPCYLFVPWRLNSY